MLPGAYRRALDGISRSVLVGVAALLRTGAPRLPQGSPGEQTRASARDALADRITRQIWEHRERARDTAHAFLIGQARRAGITGDVYTPNPPPYHRAAMRRVLADFDEAGGFARHPDQITQHVGAVAIRHTEAAARRVITDAVEGDAPDEVETHDEATARWAAREDRERQLWAENYGRSTERTRSPKRARPARWARMLTGAENCAFCVMLAARGAVYESLEEGRGGVLRPADGALAYVYHDNCDCIVVPVYSKQWDGGKTAAKLQQIYDRAQAEISDDDLQDRETDSPEQLRKLRKYLTEHTDELTKAVPNVRDQDRLAEQQRDLGLADDAVQELEPHEIRFYTEFTGTGHTVELIPRDDDRTSTNDFRWRSRDNSQVEVKRPERVSYDAIKRLVRDAVHAARTNHQFTKDRFIIDLDDRHLPDKVRMQLGLYNRRNPENQIRNLWVWSQARLIEIDLRTEK